MATTPGVCSVIIDDCQGRDLPLLEARLTGTGLHRTTTITPPALDATSEWTGEGRLAVDFFNPDVSEWEPVVEPWSFTVAATAAQQRAKCVLATQECINFTLTSAMKVT